MQLNHPVNPAPTEEKRWTTKELQEDFDVIGFASPYVTVRRKSDKVHGTLEFNGNPRYYFNFVAN